MARPDRRLVALVAALASALPGWGHAQPFDMPGNTWPAMPASGATEAPSPAGSGQSIDGLRGLGQPSEFGARTFPIAPPYAGGTPPAATGSERADAAPPPPVLRAGVRGELLLSDNLLLERAAPGGTGSRLTVAPWVQAISSAPRRRYNAVATLRGITRSEGGSEGRIEFIGDGRLAIAEHLWLDASGIVRRFTASPFGPLAPDDSSAVNRNDVRIATLSPFVTGRLAGRASAEGRYTLTAAEGTNSLLLARRTHTLSATLADLDRGGPWGWGWTGSWQRREFDAVSADRRLATATLSRLVGPTLRVRVSATYENNEILRNRSGESAGWGPGIGFDWSPGPRTRLAGDWRRAYYGDTWTADANWRGRSATAGLRASRAVVSSANASMLLFDPTRLFGGEPLNPVLAQLLLQNLLAGAGLPLSASLVTDADYIDRRLLASFGMRSPRASVLFTAFTNERQATTTINAANATGDIRGGGLISVGGLVLQRIDQRGVTLSASRRIDEGGALVGTLRWQRNEGDPGNLRTTLRQAYAGWQFRITRPLSATIGLRHTHQEGTRAYVERAVLATFDYRI